MDEFQGKNILTILIKTFFSFFIIKTSYIRYTHK